MHRTRVERELARWCGFRGRRRNKTPRVAYFNVEMRHRESLQHIAVCCFDVETKHQDILQTIVVLYFNDEIKHRESLHNVAVICFNVEIHESRELARYCGCLFQSLDTHLQHFMQACTCAHAGTPCGIAQDLADDVS